MRCTPPTLCAHHGAFSKVMISSSGSSRTRWLCLLGKAIAASSGRFGSSAVLRAQTASASRAAAPSYEGFVMHGIQPRREWVSYSQPRPRTR